MLHSLDSYEAANTFISLSSFNVPVETAAASFDVEDNGISSSEIAFLKIASPSVPYCESNLSVSKN